MTLLPVRLVLLLALALSASACQLRIGVDVDVDRKGAGVLAVSVGADPELLSRAEEAGVDPLGALIEQGRELARTGWRLTEARPAGGGLQVRLSARFSGPEEFAVLTTDLAEALAAPEVRLLEPFTLEVTEDRIIVTGAGGLVPTSAIADLGIQPAEAVRLAAEQDAVAYKVRVLLPGDVLSTTASTQEQGTLTWEIGPGERVEVRAVGTRPRPPPLLALVAAVVAVLSGSVAAVVAVRRRRLARDRTAA